MKKFRPLDLAIIAACAAIIFAQEELLTFIPNVQLTVFLLVLYSKKLGFVRTTLITMIHVLLDNLIFGTFNILFVGFMFLGWFMIPLVICSIGRKINASWLLAILAFILSLIYCWIMIVPTMITFNMEFIPYLINDIPFEIILGVSSFISTLLLYYPLSKLFDVIYKKNNTEESDL